MVQNWEFLIDLLRQWFSDLLTTRQNKDNPLALESFFNDWVCQSTTENILDFTDFCYLPPPPRLNTKLLIFKHVNDV